MELYYRDLISSDASLDKLVDDLMRVVQGANDLADAVGANLDPETRRELTTRLERLKGRCAQLRRQARKTAVAVDKVIHRHPYSSAGFGFAIGVLVGALVRRRFCGYESLQLF